MQGSSGDEVNDTLRNFNEARRLFLRSARLREGEILQEASYCGLRITYRDLVITDIAASAQVE